jgi:calcineurin-like phosphoesterase family protein
MSNQFWTADTHWDHESILRHCHRPWIRPGDLFTSGPDRGKFISRDIAKARVEEMNVGLAEKWNAVVTGRDTVIIVGDFAWKRHMHFLGALKGKKILIKGNHDEMSQEEYKNFTEVYEMRMFSLPGGKKAFACHYCMQSWPNSIHGVYHFYGHSHGRIKEQDGYLRCDVGVDVWDYSPVPAEILVAKMEFRAASGARCFFGEGDRNVADNREYNKALMLKAKAQKE